MKMIVIIMVLVEGSAAMGASGLAGWTRPMTRCECAEVSFDEVARRMRQEGLSLEEAAERTGCGRICTACLPDLRAHLSRTR
jgi:bacterioferritin-associated ferredoxin